MSPEEWHGLSSVIDQQALLRRCINNLQFAERILTLFECTCGEELVDIDRALEAGDVEAVSRIAHRLQGACANAGAFQMQACATKLRSAAKEQALPDVAACLRELRSEWQRLGAALPGQPPTPVAVSS